MSAEGPLSQLTANLSSYTAALPRAARAVTASSVDAWTPDGNAPIFALLQRVGIALQFQLQRKQTAWILFIQIPKGEWVTLEATVALEILGAWSLQPIDLLEPGSVARTGRFPTFLNVTPTPDYLSAYLPAGGDPAQTIFLELGPGGRNILAVTRPENGRHAPVRYSPAGTPGNPPDKDYPLAAFLDLSWTLRDWASAGGPTGAPVDLPPPGPRPTATHQLLSECVEAYGASYNALAKDGASVAPAMPPPLDQRFRLSDYSVSMNVSVAEDGSIAERPEDEKARLQLQLKVQSGDPTEAAVSLGIPDFIVTGALRDEIAKELHSLRQATSLAAQLGREVVEVTAFLDTARADPVFLQVGRGESGRQLLMVLSGVMKGELTNLVARADYNGDFDFLEAREYPGDAAGVMVSYEEIAHWYLPLIAKMRFWSNELLTW